MEQKKTQQRSRQRIIGVWLLLIGGMVLLMVILGGLTRLTDSGLSMVEWRPITGWLPPLSHAAWEEAFAAYRAFPEYQKINSGMSLPQFQEIYWLEYVHRLWGRLIGVAFALPLAFFVVRRWVSVDLGWKLAGIFVLGGLQGGLGWYMVKSGLIDRPDVSQYRLVAHLGMALAIYSAILWVAMRLLADAPQRPLPTSAPVLRIRGIVVLVLLTILAGGFVAGLDAGFAYNTFPLMDDQFIPDALFGSSPWWRSFFEDVTTVQFVHRTMAMVTVLAIFAFRWSLRGMPLTPPVRRAANMLVLWVPVQFSLGVATLLSYVAVPIAAMHQAGALILFTLALRCAFVLTPALPHEAVDPSCRSSGRATA